MKFIILLLTVLFQSNNVFPDTNVGGHIASNTTWTKSNSPYWLNDTISIDSGAILTIEPGVLINCATYHVIDSFNMTNYKSYSFIIYGGLKAMGTLNDSIIFRDRDPGICKGGPGCSYGWYGLHFYNSCIDTACILSYCGFERMVEIIVDSCAPTITHCNIAYGACGIRIKGDSSLVPVISYNYISGNGTGIWIQGTSPIISYNIIWPAANGGSAICFNNSNPVFRYNDIMRGLSTTSSNRIDARYNYWGTSSGDTILFRYHLDYQNLDYIPFLTEPLNGPYLGIDAPLIDNAGKTTDFMLYPNPFNSKSDIIFDFNKSSMKTIEIYNLNGIAVRNFVSSQKMIIWDGKNKKGDYVGNGIYILKVKSDNMTVFKSLVKTND